MALNDAAVITPGAGYIYVANPGTLPPTPAALKTLDPLLFGAQHITLTMTGTPTAGKWTVKSTAAETPVDVPFDASGPKIAELVASLPSIGAGNVTYVSGGPLLSTPVVLAFAGKLQGKTVPLTIVSTGLSGGTTPAVSSVTSTAPNGWSIVGHTSLENLPELAYEGGDTETKGTWQRKALREVEKEAISDHMTVQIQQFDSSSLKLYYGKNNSTTAGVFGVKGGSAPVNEKAILTIIVDGDVRLGHYVPRSNVRRDEAIKLSGEDFATLPIRATFLQLGSQDLYSWINEDLFPVEP
ncbi:phage tail protein [Nocardia brasiliensis]|uniref:phage tail tube protein n=1 Tax=Nocardia brasiliensis TaxID=37326 RepID=UPI00366F1FE3